MRRSNEILVNDLAILEAFAGAFEGQCVTGSSFPLLENELGKAQSKLRLRLFVQRCGI